MIKYKLIILLTCLLVPSMAFSHTTKKAAGFGYMAENIMEPVSIVSDFVASASLVIGVTFLFGAFFRYMQHRVNPLAIPLSSSMVLFFLGIFLLALPYAYKLSTMGGN